MERSGIARRWAWRIVLAALALPGACASRQGPKDQRPIVRTEAPPAYAGIAASYNRRVERLEALQTPITILFRVAGEDGRERKEQAEGHLQYIRPSRVALRIDKVSQTYFWLGSNEAQYWWLDLSGEERVAVVGSHAGATPESVAAFGLPVHPLDLLEVFGVLPIPAEGPVATRWSADGRGVVFDLPGRWGTRRFEVDPGTLRPTRIELLAPGAKGEEVVMRARLDGYASVEVRGDARAEASLATIVSADLPRLRTHVEVRLAEPANPTAARIKPANFDLKELERRQGVSREVSVDDATRGSPGGVR